jgi:hypothetical protein
MGFTEKYKKIIEHIKNLKESPFTFSLSEYCSDVVDNPRCHLCDKRETGIEVGMSPSFNNKWTKGWNVCFHICHFCNSKVHDATIKFIRSYI